MAGLIPHLVCAGASDAIAFYVKAFGAVELSRLPGPGGRLMHAMIRIGDAPLMLVDEMPEWGQLGPKALNGSSVIVHRYVEDVDAAFARAVAAGATATMPPTDMFWGDRYSQLVDPWGHRWSLAMHQRDLTPEQIAQAMAALPPASECAAP
jgi:uncharacterized glyoxalase superfamily protein PhnB